MTTLSLSQLQVIINQLIIDLNNFNTIVNGNSTTTITLEDGSVVPSVSNLLAGITNSTSAAILQLESVINSVSNTLNETPSGNIDGVNRVFNLSAVPISNTATQLFYNGTLLQSGTNKDYTLVGSVITMSFTPNIGDILIANYIKQGVVVAPNNVIVSAYEHEFTVTNTSVDTVITLTNLVFVTSLSFNGIVQDNDVFTLVGNTITIPTSVGLEAGDQVIVNYLASQ